MFNYLIKNQKNLLLLVSLLVSWLPWRHESGEVGGVVAVAGHPLLINRFHAAPVPLPQLLVRIEVLTADAFTTIIFRLWQIGS